MYIAAKNNDKLQKKARGTGWDIVLKVWIQPLSSSNILLTTRFLCINVTQHVISLMLLNICPLRRQVPVQMFNVHDNFIDTPFKGRGSSGTALDNTWPNLQWKKHQKIAFFSNHVQTTLRASFSSSPWERCPHPWWHQWWRGPHPISWVSPLKVGIRNRKFVVSPSIRFSLLKSTEIGFFCK